MGSSTTTTVTIQTCPYCGLSHTNVCWKIQEIEYHPDGSVKRVRFYDYASPVQYIPYIPPNLPWQVTCGAV